MPLFKFADSQAKCIYLYKKKHVTYVIALCNKTAVLTYTI